MRIVVTGADGFIGRALTAALKDAGHEIAACTMAAQPLGPIPAGVAQFVSGPITAGTDWGKILRKDDVIVHLAARVHVMREDAADPLAEFRAVNTAGTANLARQAAAAGVKRFVFMSTVGVNGNNSGTHLYKEGDPPRPHNYYSVSKWEAETELAAMAKTSAMQVVVVRAPLVYGPGNPGNFNSLLRLVSAGVPLPLASVRNVKSFVSVQNLVSALALCCAHANAAGLYLVSDSEFVSTPDLIRKLAAFMGRPARLFPFPAGLLALAGKLAGRRSAVESLLLPLAVDSAKIRRQLGWRAPVSLDEGLRRTVEWFAAREKRL